MVRFHVLPNKEEQEYFKLLNSSTSLDEFGGYLQLQGKPLIGSDATDSWNLAEVANQNLLYAHPGGLQPTVDRFRLKLTLDAQRMFYQQRRFKRRRKRNAQVSESELELPVRIVRLYDNVSFFGNFVAEICKPR